MMEQSMLNFFLDILKSDKYYYLLDTSSDDLYISEAVKRGALLAEKYFGADLVSELSKKNIALNYSEVDTRYYGMVIYGRTIKNRKGVSVEIFTKALAEKYARLINEKKPIDEELLLKVHLAHEFYHAVADSESNEYHGPPHDSLDTKYQRCLFFKRKKSIKALEEISAHAFSYYYCNKLYSSRDSGNEVIPAYYFCE